jgi:hypothetical protein
VCEEVIHKVLVNTTSLAHGTIFVVLLLAICVMSDYRVDEDITWAGIEIIAGINTTLAIWRDKANIGNTADVLACSKLSRVVENERIEERY